MLNMRFIFIFFLSLSMGSLHLTAQEDEFGEMLDNLYHWTVPLITPAELQANGLDRYTLLDAREEEEFNVSHIKGAHYVGFSHFDQKKVSKIDKDEPVVVYCSVGYRSERIGEKLKKMGFETVYNLYGGIFEWKNQGYQVENQEGKETQKVHAYSKKWGKWLKAGEKVYEK